MSWASRRQLIIFSLVGIVSVAVFAVLTFVVVYKAPSCSDGIKNQGEAGIDCGGPCPYLCTDQMHAPVVLFTKTLSQVLGRTDVIASVQNTNMTAAAKRVPYTVTLYGDHQVLLKEVTGTVDLPPFSTVPIFVPNISSGSQPVTAAFLTIDASAPRWFTFDGRTRDMPVVTTTTLDGASSTPRIDAVLGNGSVTALVSVPVVVVVHDSGGKVIAASQTIVPSIPPQGQATATFTWNVPFPGIPATIEVVPVIPLP